jgi:hypothetical protein
MVNDWYFVKGSRSGHRILYTQAYVAKVPLLLIDWEDKEQVSLHNEIVTIVQRALDGDDSYEESQIEICFGSLTESKL